MNTGICIFSAASEEQEFLGLFFVFPSEFHTYLVETKKNHLFILFLFFLPFSSLSFNPPPLFFSYLVLTFLKLRRFTPSMMQSPLSFNFFPHTVTFHNFNCFLQKPYQTHPSLQIVYPYSILWFFFLTVFLDILYTAHDILTSAAENIF